MDIVTLGAALRGAKMYTDATIAPLLGGVHYRGSVNYASNLPASPEEGDAYTVKYKGTTGTDPNDAEYVWGLDTDDNTYKWIVFSADSYTTAEVDALLSGKQATIDSTHKLSADLVADTNSTHKFVTASEKAMITENADAIASAESKIMLITDELDTKQDTLTFDTTPTQGSTNPVTSGGIYNVIGDINTVLEEVL